MTLPEQKIFHPKEDHGLRHLFLMLMMLTIFLVASRSPIDSDLWWHLQSGKVMAETGHPLLTDTFSYTRAGEVWVNHSWLGEVVLYGIYRMTGWIGLSAWMGLMAVLIALLLWIQTSGSAYMKAAVILLTSVVCAPLWTPRPQFFSLLLLALTAWLVQHWMTKGGRVIWLVIGLFILWSNLHAGYVMGILFLLAYATGLAVDAVLLVNPERKTALKKAAILLATAFGGYLAAAINPNGYRMWLIPFQTVGVGILRQFIQEWSSPDFHSIESWPFAFFIILMMFCLARQVNRTTFRHIFPAMLFILLGLYARRNMAAAAIVATPVLLIAWNGMAVQGFFRQLIPVSIRDWVARYRGSQTQLTEKQKKWINLSMVAIMGLICFVKLAGVGYPGLVNMYEAKFFPAKAVDYMQNHAPNHTGRLFNSYNWGGYLIWKNPGTPVYVDGRTDLYGDDILGEWMTITQAGENWQELLAQRGVTRIIIEPNRPLVSVLPSAGWIEQYRDEQAVIFDLK